MVGGGGKTGGIGAIGGIVATAVRFGGCGAFSAGSEPICAGSSLKTGADVGITGVVGACGIAGAAVAGGISDARRRLHPSW